MAGGQRVPFNVGEGNAGVFRETQVGNAASLLPSNVLPSSGGAVFYRAADRAAPAEKGSGIFLGKYFYPSALQQGSRYQVSSSDKLMGRATDAASRVFLTRDVAGTRRLNTSYLLRVATSVAADTASRPYWRRSGKAPLSDFGSTIGSDAGMNLLHEFGPGLQHVVTSHLPKFVWRIEERFLHGKNPLDQSPRAGVAIPGR